MYSFEGLLIPRNFPFVGTAVFQPGSFKEETGYPFGKQSSVSPLLRCFPPFLKKLLCCMLLHKSPVSKISLLCCPMLLHNGPVLKISCPSCQGWSPTPILFRKILARPLNGGSKTYCAGLFYGTLDNPHAGFATETCAFSFWTQFWQSRDIFKIPSEVLKLCEMQSWVKVSWKLNVLRQSICKTSNVLFFLEKSQIQG